MSDETEALSSTVWGHIEARRFVEAEVVLRRLIDMTDPDAPHRLNMWFGMLAGVLNSLGRPDEGTEMYRRALDEAKRMGPPSVDVGRFMLGNQYLLFGDPRDALEMVDPIPSGVGHVQSLLHAVAAESLWKLEREDEARTRAHEAIGAAPTDERRTKLSLQLEYILRGA